MDFLFSYDNRFHIKCQRIEGGGKVIARLTQLDSNLHPIDKSVDVCRALADIFLKRCEGFVRNEHYSYGDFNYSYERINSARKEVNKAFRMLGFPSDCYSGSELCANVSCVPLKDAVEIIEPILQTEEQLLNQEILFEQSEKKLSILSPDMLQKVFSINQHAHCVFLYGEGGIGKTNLLKLLEKQGKSRSQSVYYCSLSTLLDDALLNPIRNSLHCGKDILRAGAFANGYTSHLFRYCEIQRFSIEQEYVFLLDGLNEMFDRNTNRTYECIQQILTEISMLHNAEIRLIISSRNVRDITKLPFSERIVSATLTGVLEKDDILQTGGTDESRRLLSKPLFFQLYRRLYRQNRTLPQTAFEIWSVFHMEASKQEYTKKNISKESALYTYFILLPLFAYYMESDHAEKLTRFQALRLMEQLSHSTIAQERSQFVVNQIVYQSSKQQFKPSQFPFIPFEALQNLENFVIYKKQSDSIEFRHQDIREYFAAFYIIWFLKSIKTIPLELCSIPNFNLKASIRKMVLSALNFEQRDSLSNSSDNYGEYQRNHNERYAQLFPCIEDLSARTNLMEVHAQIQQNLSLAYIAHDFSDRFFLLVDQERYSIMAPLCESLMQSGRFLYDYPEILSDIERNVLLQVYATAMYHFHHERDYGKCREIYEFCRQYVISRHNNRYAIKIEHQRAKALLCCCQDIYTGHAMKSSFYEKPEFNDPKEMFHEAVEILRKCLPFNLSVNTLAHFYMYPVYWMQENKLIQRDPLKAFQIYKLLYDESNNRHYLYSQNGSDLSYTYRQMAGLLIKGYLRLVNGRLLPSDASPLVSQDDCRETMQYAEEILKHIDGHDYVHTDWLRGAIELFKGNIAQAQQFFMSDPNYLLTKIIYLIKHWSTDEEALTVSVQEDILQLKAVYNKTVRHDKTDACYLLEDAKLLGFPV